MNRVVFSSASEHWETPKTLYDALDAEFHFVDDPCPLGGLEFGLTRDWYSPCFLNPPWTRRDPITPWLEKAHNEAQRGVTVVCLIPSRTDTQWFQSVFKSAQEILFLAGRLKFGGSRHNAPFPSALVLDGPSAWSLRPFSDWGHLVVLQQSHQHEGPFVASGLSTDRKSALSVSVALGQREHDHHILSAAEESPMQCQPPQLSSRGKDE